MKEKLLRLEEVMSTCLFTCLAALFAIVLPGSFIDNTLRMCSKVNGVGFTIFKEGNYVGLFAGFLAYIIVLAFLAIPRVRHNLAWFMNFTHELTHTLAALIFFGKIREFVVRDKECYVSYLTGPIGYVPITLSPYCIPIYTLMLFPFRFAGDSHFLIIFDLLIAFTYSFHIHSFIKQTRFTQPDIINCGKARSVAFISFVHLWVLSVIMAIPKGGVINALFRVCYEYPVKLLTNPVAWFIELKELL